MNLALFPRPGRAAFEGERADPASLAQAHMGAPVDRQIALRNFAVRITLQAPRQIADEESCESPR